MLEFADAHYPILAVDERDRAIIDEVIGDIIQDTESDYAEHYYVWKNGWIVLAALLVHANLKTDPFVAE